MTIEKKIIRYATLGFGKLVVTAYNGDNGKVIAEQKLTLEQTEQAFNRMKEDLNYSFQKRVKSTMLFGEVVIYTQYYSM